MQNLQEWFHVDYWPPDDREGDLTIKHLVETLQLVNSVSECECEQSDLNSDGVRQLGVKLEKLFYHGLCLLCMKNNETGSDSKCDQHNLGSTFELCKRQDAPMWREDPSDRLKLERIYYFAEQPDDCRLPIR